LTVIVTLLRRLCIVLTATVKLTCLYAVDYCQHHNRSNSTMSGYERDPATIERERAHRRRGEAARPGKTEDERRQRVNADRRARANGHHFTPRYCRLCSRAKTLYRTRQGLNNHTSGKHAHRYRMRGDAYIPLTEEELARARQRVLAGQGRRRRSDPADKEPVQPPMEEPPVADVRRVVVDRAAHHTPPGRVVKNRRRRRKPNPTHRRSRDEACWC